MSSRTRSMVETVFGPLLPTFKPNPVNLSGRTALVSGANVGIGFEIARDLSSMGATVVLICRNQVKAEKARTDILNAANGAIKPKQLEIMILDFGDLDSVRKFADSLGGRPIDILINNAGITSNAYTRNPQGFEQTYTVNVLSHFLLTLLLLPHMQNFARIVNVSSNGNYEVRQQIDPNDLDCSTTLENEYRLKLGDALVLGHTMLLYSRTKLLQIFVTQEMQVRIDRSSSYKDKHITVHAYHPGLVQTAIWNREDGLDTPTVIQFIVNLLGISANQGAATGTFLATDEGPLKSKGMYWERMGLRTPNLLVQGGNVQRLIWEQMVLECKLPIELKI